MKRILSLLLIAAMCICLCACGQSKAAKAADEAIAAIGEVTIDSGEAIANAEKLYSILTDDEKSTVKNRLVLVEAQEAYSELREEIVYENAKTAYEQLKKVSELCITGMDSIYDAWHWAMYDLNDVYADSAVFLSMGFEVTGFTVDEIEGAAEALGYDGGDAKANWNVCLWVAQQALTERGDYAEVQANMDSAAAILQELTEEYDDYTYYPKLKEYYSSISSYVDFFVSPSGSFNQLADTINSYENGIRTLEADVAFLFSK